MKYDSIAIRKGNLYTKAYREILDNTPRKDKKSKVRYEIENNVFDIRDSVADNSKMISLLFGMVMHIYNALDTTTKDNIDPNIRSMIEYAIQKYDSIDTWGEIQLANEGTLAIDRLIDRQAQIGDIIKANYNI